jgi:hypothetical protein
MKMGYLECNICEVIKEVRLADNVRDGDLVKGFCPNCENQNCLEAIIEEED